MAENKTVENKDKEKKPNWFVTKAKAAKKWVHELRVELKKVVWPSKKEVANNTVVVTAVVAAVGVCIWVFDALSAGVVRALINLFAG